MSNVRRRAGAAVKRLRKQSEAGSLSPRVQEMVGELHKLCDAIEGGASVDDVARVRPAPINVKPAAVGPADVRAVRESLGLSQAMFADFLGVGLSTLRRWELGQVVPSAVARRFLGEVRDDPNYWRKKLLR